MIKVRLFVMSALMMLLVVGTAMAQGAPGAAGEPNAGGGSTWFFPGDPRIRGRDSRFWRARSATARQSPRLAKARRAIPAQARAYSLC